jgi:hypothetical protein
MLLTGIYVLGDVQGRAIYSHLSETAILCLSLSLSLEAMHNIYLGSHSRLCALVVRVPGYRTEMYCVSCEVRTEFIYVM